MSTRKIMQVILALFVAVSMVGTSMASAMGSQEAFREAHKVVPQATPTKDGVRQLGKLTSQQSATPLSFATARQNAVGYGGVATRAIDGNTDGTWSNGSVTHTGTTTNSWWQGELDYLSYIDVIEIYNRTDNSPERLKNFYILVSDQSMAGMTLAQAQAVATGQRFVDSQVPTTGAYNWTTVDAVGKYVMIYKQADHVLSLAEVKVQGTQVAPSLPFATARQNAVGYGGVATRAIDGNTDGTWSNGSVTHTGTTTNSWWQGELATMSDIRMIQIYNRTDNSPERLKNFYILVSDQSMAGMTLAQAQAVATGQRFVDSQVPTTGAYNWTTVDAVGKYVMIYKQADHVLSLAEVKVQGFAYLPFATASQNAVGYGGVAERAIDGNTDGTWSNGSVTHTGTTTNSWWQGELKAPGMISEIEIYNRTDANPHRLKNFYIVISDQNMDGMSLSTVGLTVAAATIYVSNIVPTTEPYVWTLPEPVMGKYVKIYKPSNGYLSLAEVRVKGNPEVEGYRYYRFDTTAVRGGAATVAEVSELNFYDEAGGRYPATDVSTNGLVNQVIDYGTPKDFAHYDIMTSANQNNSVDPVSWVIEGSNDRVNWVSLDEEENYDTPTTPNVVQTRQLLMGETLMEHPDKAQHVAFVGEETPRYQPSDYRSIVEQQVGYEIKRLRYTTAGNLVFEHLPSPTGTPQVLWQASASCTNGHVEVSADYGLALFCDSDSTPEWSVLSAQPHTNFHLGIYNNELGLFNVETKTQVWRVTSSGASIENTLLSNTLIKKIWDEQGWTHHQNWTGAQIDKFLELFSDNHTDPHADAHRMLERMHAYDQHHGRQLGWFDWIGNTSTVKAQFKLKDAVDNLDSLKNFVEQYAIIAQDIMDNLSAETMTQDLLADHIFTQVMQDEDLTPTLTAYNYLFSSDPSAGNMSSVPTSSNIYDNAWTRFLEQHPDRSDEFRIDASLNLETVWNGVKTLDDITNFPDGEKNPLKAVLNLQVTYALTIPEFDSTQNVNVASYTHKFRLGLFDGVKLNVGDAGTTGNVAVDTIAHMLDFSAGIYGNHEFQLEVVRDTENLNSEGNPSIIDHRATYRYNVGIMGEGSASMQNAFDFWITPDDIDILDMIESDTDAADLFNASITQYASNGSFPVGTTLSSETQSAVSTLSRSSSEFSLSEADSFATALMSMSEDEQSFFTAMMEEGVYDVETTNPNSVTGFEISPIFDVGSTKPVAVTNSQTGEIVNIGNGTAQETFSVSEAIWTKIQNTPAGTPTPEAIATWMGFANSEAATAWVTQMAFRRSMGLLNNLIGSSITARGGAQFSLVVENWGQLTRKQKNAIFWAGFGGNLAGASAGFTAAFWAAMPPNMNAAVTGMGSEAGGLLGVTLAVAFMDGVQLDTDMHFSTCIIGGVKPLALSLPNLGTYDYAHTTSQTLFNQTLKGVSLSYSILLSNCQSGNILDD